MMNVISLFLLIFEPAMGIFSKFLKFFYSVLTLLNYTFLRSINYEFNTKILTFFSLLLHFNNLF